MNLIEWRVSPAFPKYEVSNTGCIRRLNKRNGAVRKLKTRSDGYMDVNLWVNGEEYNCLVHRLVANAFLGIDLYDKSIVIDHIDGSRHNNHVDNLRPLSRTENAKSYLNIKDNNPDLAKRNAHNGIWYTINDNHTYNFHRSWYMANDEAPGKEIYFQKYGVNVEPEIVK